MQVQVVGAPVRLVAQREADAHAGSDGDGDARKTISRQSSGPVNATGALWYAARLEQREVSHGVVSFRA